jgi:diguanylate cyclase (GGDEF)-like protein
MSQPIHARTKTQGATSPELGPSTLRTPESQRPDWTLASLTVLLSTIRSATTREQAVRLTVDAAAEALDAEVVVLLSNDCIDASTGFGSEEVSIPSLQAAASVRHSSLEVRGLGTCASLSTGIDGHPELRLLAARFGSDPFVANESALLEGIASVLGLMLNLLDRIRRERDVQSRTEALLEITNAIARREPHDTLQSLIALRTRELLRADSVVLRAVDPGKVGQRTRVVCSEGLTADEVAAFDSFDGLGGMAIGAERIVETYGDDLAWVKAILPNLTSAMASPISVDGVARGSLGAMSAEPGRTFSSDEKSLLQALAELSSIVFTDAHSIQAVTAARHDLLTGLPGRGLTLDRLTDVLESEQGGTVSVLFLDLDKFKPVNDRFGHEVGDAVLRVLSGRMTSLVESYRSGCVGRIGGDEFVAFITSDHDGRDEELASALIGTICRPIPVTVGSRVLEVSVGVSLGIATSTVGSTASDLMRQSDAAMYQAKATGGDRWRRYVELSSANAAG